MKMYAPIERQKIYELVAERLADQIVDGELAVGASLPTERELAESHGVGRSSIREALRMLESRGLVESRGKGTFVVGTPRSPLNHSLGLLLASEQGSAGELFEVRRILECEAATLAALRRTNEQLAQLGEATELMRQALGSGAEYIEADLRFHMVIAEATGNRVIVHLMHAIRDQLTELLETLFRVPNGPERSVEQHRGITAAIAARDAELARTLMYDHIARVERELEEVH